MTSAAVISLERVDHAFGLLLDVLALLACALVALMVAVICADVLTRASRLGNLPWAAEVAEYTLYLSTFLAAPWLLREGKHVRMDLGLKAVPPHVGWVLEVITDGIGLATCAALCMASGKAALASAQQGSIVLKIFVFPEWWVITPAAFLFGLLAIEFAFRMRRMWRGPKTLRLEATSAG